MPNVYYTDLHKYEHVEFSRSPLFITLLSLIFHLHQIFMCRFLCRFRDRMFPWTHFHRRRSANRSRYQRLFNIPICLFACTPHRLLKCFPWNGDSETHNVGKFVEIVGHVSIVVRLFKYLKLWIKKEINFFLRSAPTPQ